LKQEKAIGIAPAAKAPGSHFVMAAIREVILYLKNTKLKLQVLCTFVAANKMAAV
jgi:hypothetical protein